MQSLHAFAGDGVGADFVWRESHLARRILVLRDAHVAELLPDVPERLDAFLSLRLCDRIVPAFFLFEDRLFLIVRRVRQTLFEPCLSVLQQLAVDVNQHIDIGLPSLLQNPLFIETGGALAIQKRSRSFRQLSRREGRLDRVVVARRNRIELVVMTAGTLQRMAEKCFTDAVGHVVQKPLPSHLCDLHASQFPRPHPQKADRHQAFWIVQHDLITSDLLLHKLVVWLVVIERPNDIVAISPGVAAFIVIGKSR